METTYTPYTERTPLTHSQYKSKNYPLPLTLSWRVFHNINYLIGGITFAIGSYQYFPSVSDYVLGGWLFTIGSLGFGIADCLEWWTNNRVGCFHYNEYEMSYESLVSNIYDPKESLTGKFQRAEVGLNFFLSLIGSTLYLIGSILFIPDLNTITQGTQVFIIGSLIIFLSQGWKVWRAGQINEHYPGKRQFALENYSQDIWAFLVDLTAGLGGLAYCIGSIYFLPQYNTSTEITYIAAVWFQIGGINFFASGVFMFFRYFFFGKF